MALFKALDERLAGACLDLPIDGKTYRISEPNAETGLRLQAVVSLGVSAAAKRDPRATDLALLNDDQEIDLYRDALGTAYDEMRADGLDWPRFRLAGMTAVLYWGASEDAAQAFWEAKGKAEAPANREERRTASKGSRSTAAASKTRRRASSSGTTSRRT